MPELNPHTKRGATEAPGYCGVLAQSEHDVASALRGLWRAAERVDIAFKDPEFLASELKEETRGPRQVRLVTGAEIVCSLPRNWLVWSSAGVLSRELVLAYGPASSFPELALIFTGPPDDRWATVHRRPLLLHKLRAYFEELLARADAASSAPPAPPAPLLVRAIREAPQQSQLHGNRSREPQLPEASFMTPVQLYRLVLSSHFADAISPTDGEVNLAAGLASHQLRAYERACSILDRYGGVIIADSVGLGKTFVALRLLARARSNSERAVVIVPAALRGQWERELQYLSAQPAEASGRSEPTSGNLELWVNERSDAVALVSMESLGRENADVSAISDADLVIVDEAHNFRNPTTRRYKRLIALAHHAQMVLLTATPVNNSIRDLEHLLDLFAAPGAFRHLGVSDYREVFRSTALDSPEMRTIIGACIVRRTRRFLRAHYGTVRVRDPITGEERELRFPKREPPRTVEWDIVQTYGDLYENLEGWIEALRFPSFETGYPGRELLKIILLKRLESSVEAFRCSIIQQLAWCDTALRALAAGRTLTRLDYRSAFRGPQDDPGSQLAFFELMLPPTREDSSHVEAFRRDLESDRTTLMAIHRSLASDVGCRRDRKLHALKGLLQEELAGRKLIIFSEFRDTARYLHRQLRDLPRLARVDSSQARLGWERATRREVIERFAPLSNGLTEPRSIERVDVLIATDVLSEGLNLQDASVVLSYDLPWNPVRLMQRIGRIDRLGAVPESVVLYNFAPAAQLDRLLRLMDRLHEKVGTIDAALGADQQLFPFRSKCATRPSDHIRALTSNAQGLDALEDALEGPNDPEELAYLDFAASRKHLRQPSPSAAPGASIVSSNDLTVPQAYAYWRISSGRSSRALWLLYDASTRRVVEDQRGAIAGFKRKGDPQPSERGTELLARARLAFTRHVQAALAHLEAARIAGDWLKPGLPQCKIAAWVAREFARQRLRMSSEERRRVDALLERLGRRYTVAEEGRLSQLLNRLPARLDRESLARLEGVLSDMVIETEPPGAAHEIATLLAIPA